MLENVRKKVIQEKAAISMLIIVTILSFAAILTGAFLTVATLKKSQLESDIRLQEIYGEDVDRVDEIYAELMAQDKQGPNCEITYEIPSETQISYKFSFNEDVKGFETTDIKLYNATKVTTSFGDSITLSTSTPAYTTNVTEGETYVITFDYEGVENEQFELGIYSDTVENLPTKTLVATNEKKHEEYKVQITTSKEIFKIIRNTQNGNDIKISNFEILKIGDDSIEKGTFTKIDEKTYKLMASYNTDSRYVVIIEKDTLTDIKENKNLEIIKCI